MKQTVWVSYVFIVCFFSLKKHMICRILIVNMYDLDFDLELLF